jgi:hypothetical protein
MSYGTIKVDTITFTDNSVDKSVSLSGLIQNPTFTGNITVTGTISGDVIRGGTTVSGATVTGTTANFVSGVFTTQISGATVTGTTASFTSGVFTNISGTTTTITSGIIASGTAAAPSLAILADLDTGLFSPGANELAVATNGTGRLFINSSGQVGVGATESSSTFGVHGTNAGGYVVSRINNTSATGFARLLFDINGGTNGTADISYVPGTFFAVGPSSNDTTTPIVFRNNNASERLRITSAGLVGVGTSSPGYKFEVDNTGGSTATARLIGNDQANVRLRIQNTGTSGRAYEIVGGLNGANNSHLSIYDATAAATRLTITETGLVGIGTSSPGQGQAQINITAAGASDINAIALNLTNNSTAAGTGVSLRFSPGNVLTALRGSYINSLISGANGSDLQFWTCGDGVVPGERMRIDSSGNVGIGITAPSAKLHVSITGAANASTTDALILNNDNSNVADNLTTGISWMRTGNNGSYIYTRISSIRTGTHDTDLAFSVNEGGTLSERLRLDSLGRLLVGTSSAISDAFIQIRGNSSGGIYEGKITMFPDLANSSINSTTTLGNLQFSGAEGGIGATITGHGDAQWGTNDYPGRLVFSTTADGAASPTERLRITSAGLVGIGTTTPDSKLSVDNTRSDTAGSGFFAITGNTSAKRGLRLNTTNGLCFDYYDGSTWSQQAVLTSGGLVGIGTTSASTILHVASTAPYIRIQDTDSSTGVTAQGGFEMYDSDGDRLFYLANESSSSSDVSLFNIAGGALKFGTSGSERGQFDSSGRLLVGTSSSSNVTRAEFYGQSSSSTEQAIVRFGRGSNPSGAGDHLTTLQFAALTSGGVYATIEALCDGTPGASDYPGRIVLATTADGASSPTERMRIRNGGEIDMTSSDHVLSAITSVAAGTVKYLYRGTHSSSTISFNVWSNGDVSNTNNSYGSISDIKLKENIVDANSQWDDLKALQVRNYNFKEGQTHTQIGLVAQEVELVSPGLVYESPDCDEDGNDLGTVTKSVNYSVLYMKAVKALQEAMERIETLEASNTDLLVRVTALESA